MKVKQMQKCPVCKLETSDVWAIKCPMKGCTGTLRPMAQTRVQKPVIGSLSRLDDK